MQGWDNYRNFVAFISIITNKFIKMKAYVFPGQGAQFVGMGKDLYDSNPLAKELFDKANDILGYSITDMVAGHSLGEFSALVASGALSFEDGLRLVYARAMAMQRACELASGMMAAIVGLDDAVVEEVCEKVSSPANVVVAANYNCPGQLVISGNIDAVNSACELLKEAGAKRALPLKVGGAFHSPLMQPAKDELQTAIENTTFTAPKCPIYQNVDGKAHTEPNEIKQNLIAQLTSSVRWTSSVQNMIAAGADDFTECGPGKALQGMIGRINKDVAAHSI